MAEIDRRTFHLASIYGLWGLIGASLSIPAAVYLLLPPPTRKGEEWVDAGTVSQLEPGHPQEWVFRRNRTDGWTVMSENTTAWVVKKSDHELIAFGPQCPHLGCAYHWQAGNQTFLCPCHASTFSIDGEVLTGPAPRALDRYETRVEGGKLLLGSVRQSEEKQS